MTDSQFMSAKAKEKVLRQWRKFVLDGFKFDDFKKSLYEHLIYNCSFIAHYNRQGFWDTYFFDPEATLRFLRQFDRSDMGSVEFGGRGWILDQAYNDLNDAMVGVLEPHIARIRKELRKVVAEKLRQQANALMKRAAEYGYESAEG